MNIFEKALRTITGGEHKKVTTTVELPTTKDVNGKVYFHRQGSYVLFEKEIDYSESDDS